MDAESLLLFSLGAAGIAVVVHWWYMRGRGGH